MEKTTSIMDDVQNENYKAFWNHLLARNPSEEIYSKATKLAYRSRELKGHSLVVVQYISFEKNLVGVFIRGEKNVPPEDIQNRLRPFANELAKTLRRNLVIGTKYFFHASRHFNTKDIAKWDDMADWLHKKANTYEETLRRVMQE